MRRHLAIVIGLLAIEISIGCNRHSATISTPTREPAVAPRSSITKTSVEMENRSRPRDKNSVPDNKPQLKPVAAAPDVANKKERVAVNQSERMAILTPGGPIVTDVSLTIDGRPIADVFEQVVANVLTAADRDKNGRPTWKNLADNKNYLAAQAVNEAPGGAGQLKTWTERFDRNRDGQIQRDEAAAWLGRDAGVTARAFDVRGSRSYG